ncbi:Phosphoenolpyruvate-dependent sugar phosphotransferase system EIIABC [Priestia megaterium WSH-002]|uniref:Phosphoenolpyruvate-dependent sugar phosphotransferase system EIIABC n=2 Tax=Priestia TaxID=2800373 RepID=A0A8D3WX39_PRIMW|nr:Phosphoenolpyruvate-dependent sugar phosphotransferase system EIIABC [Priestia megaterium WSH-002]
MSKHHQTAKELLQALGGSSNIANYTHCMTRLRVTPVNHNRIDEASIKQVKGVLGVVDDDTYQIILGPGVVTKVAEQFGIVLQEDSTAPSHEKASSEDLTSKGADMKSELKKKNNTPFKNFLRKVGSVFIPLIPAFVGAGLIAGIASILANSITAGDLDKDTWQQYVTILNVIKNAIFSYLVIYVGINAAKEFGATPALGGVIGGITLLTGVTEEFPIMNIFTDQPLTPGQGGVIGVLIAVWLLSFLEKFLRRFIPDAIDIIVTPTVALLIVGLLTIFFIMPFAGLISSNLIGGIDWTLERGGVFAGFVLGVAFLPLVMLGLHQVLIPIHIEMINTAGMTILLPILAMSGAGQVGATLALWIRCRKNKSLVTIIKGALPVGILGIGEPLIYGVILPLGRPFITACIGGGIGGAVIGMFENVGSIAIGPSGLALIPLIAHGLWLKYIIGLLAGYAGGFICTYLFGIPKEAITEDSNNKEVSETKAKAEVAATGEKKEMNDTTLESAFKLPFDGYIVPLEGVPDAVFSSKMMGDGFAIEPTNNTLVSPINGEVVSIFPTKHAIGLKTDHDLELLIHVGLETVNLNGKGFTCLIKEGEKVTQGTPLLKIDLNYIKENAKSLVTPIIFTNLSEHNQIQLLKTGYNEQGITNIIELVSKKQ